MNVRTLGRGYAWLDTGTMDSLYEAASSCAPYSARQGLPIAVAEEIAYENGWITREQLFEAAEKYGKSRTASTSKMWPMTRSSLSRKLPEAV